MGSIGGGGFIRWVFGCDLLPEEMIIQRRRCYEAFVVFGFRHIRFGFESFFADLEVLRATEDQEHSLPVQ